MTNRPHRPVLAAAAAALALALAWPAAQAQAQAPTEERATLEQLRATTLGLIEALVSQGLLTRERADALLRQAAPPAPRPAEPQWGAPPGSPPAGSRTIRVPYIPESMRAQMREEIKNEVLAVAREERWADPRLIPEWVRGLQVEGDVRVRWQAEGFDTPRYQIDPGTGAIVGGVCAIVGGNLPAECWRQQIDLASSPAWAPDLLNTTQDRKRMTLRARLGFNAKVSDDTTLGLRLSTGTTSGPTSSSQTLGSGFNKASLVIDRAFVRWEPRYDLRVIAGRMANPFFGSDLLWPDDLGFDGIALQAERNIVPGLYAFATGGAFPLEEFNVDSRDKWLYALQVGADWAFSDHGTLRVGLALYDFANVEGVRENDPAPGGSRAGTVPYQTSQYPAVLRLKGNTLINLNDPTSTAAPVWGLASKFRPLNLSALVTLKHFDPWDITVGLDWVRNSAFDLADIRRRAGATTASALDSLAERSTGVQLKGSLGAARLANAGDWQLTAAYRKFERDSWIDGFTDTTWHLGGTSYKGWQLGGQYAFDRRTTLGLRLTSTRNLDDGVRDTTGGVTRATLSSAPLKIDVLQVDLNSRF